MKPSHLASLYPAVSDLAILSFKKKGGKGSDLGGLSGADDLDLEGGSLSLSDLGGSLGSLTKLDRKDKKDKKDKEDLGGLGGLGSGLGDDLLSNLSTVGSGRADDKKFMEIEASVNDLKKHAETTDLNSKATKNEIESMRKDLSQINDSIKSLLNVYEAVSRQYNPFVEDDTAGKTSASSNMDEGLSPSRGGNLSLGGLDRQKGLGGPVPADENGPLDRIVRPEDAEEDEDYSLGEMEMPKVPSSLLGKIEVTPPPAAAPEPEDDIPARTQGRPPSAASSMIDAYALEQVHKLVEYQLSKVYRAKLIGEELTRDEIDALDRWMSEFKRLGGN